MKPILFIIGFLILGYVQSCRGDDDTTKASWYGSKKDGTIGKLMANGKPFDPTKLTAASWDFPLGSRLAVMRNAKTIVVEITDRGPAKRLYNKGRKLDLSRAAFKHLAPLKEGIICVTFFQIKTRK
jgi:rare lipoprotein A